MVPVNGIRHVAVVGTGVIGASWTALFLSKGLRVTAADPVVGAEQRLRAYVRSAWAALQALDSDIESIEAAEKRLTFDANRLEDHLPNVDFVQENGPEKIDYKQEMFTWLSNKTRKHVVLASSSSGIPASRYAGQAANQGENILVGHPFNPPHLIPLVEVVGHPHTSSEAIHTATDFYRGLNRVPVVLQKESPGFVANRLQAALVHEAYSLVSRGFISSEDLDSVVSNSLALRWALHGPFLTKVLGGGGGAGGFRKHLAHVGTAAREWATDMAANPYVPDKETQARLAASVDSQLQAMGTKAVDALPTQRDNFLVQLLRIKQSAARLNETE